MARPEPRVPPKPSLAAPRRELAAEGDGRDPPEAALDPLELPVLREEMDGSRSRHQERWPNPNPRRGRALNAHEHRIRLQLTFTILLRSVARHRPRASLQTPPDLLVDFTGLLHEDAFITTGERHRPRHDPRLQLEEILIQGNDTACIPVRPPSESLYTLKGVQRSKTKCPCPSPQ